MKKLIFCLILLCLNMVTTAQAKDTVCSGVNLMDKMRADDPTKIKQIEESAAKLPYGKGLLWKVTKPGLKPSYIYGTIHLSDPRLIRMPANVQAAYDASNTLALEVTEILEPKKMAGKAFAMMKYTAYLDGSTLSDKMNEKQVAIVKSRLENRAGLPWNVAKKMRPWVVMGALALPACELARKQAGKPFLDMAIGLSAKKDGKTIAALETLESQMSTMASLPESMMIDALIQSATMGDQINDLFETMIDLYLKQETGMIWTMMRHLGPEGLDPEEMASGYAEFQKVVVDQRNVTMAEESAKLIEKGSAFIALGALHLPGDKGILSILAHRGFTITRQ